MTRIVVVMILSVFGIAQNPVAHKQDCADPSAAQAATSRIAKADSFSLIDPLTNMFRTSDQRKSCSVYYPLPNNWQNWHCGPPGYGSPCGGPQQCSCGDPHYSLVTYQCQEGTYYVCEQSPGC